MSDERAFGPYGVLFGARDVVEQMSYRSLVQRMLDVEAALAEAEGDLDIIPQFAVAPIRAAAHADLYDLPRIAEDALEAGNLAIPLVRDLTKRVESIEAAAAGYVHWGSTSQDILDTALVLQLQAAVPAVLERRSFPPESAAWVDASNVNHSELRG